MCKHCNIGCTPHKLEYLGLANAANSFCKDISGRNNVEVVFRHSGISTSIPKELSLSLFRVLQESLQNAIKYSQVKKFSVDLSGTPQYIELTLSDNGIGFDEREAFTREGLGLISMRERLQMVHGVLEIKTLTGARTTILARVPLQTTELQAKDG